MIQKLAFQILAAAGYSHGCLMAPVPEIVYEEIKEISTSIPLQDLVIGQENTIHGIESRPHITIMYGIDDVDAAEKIKNIFKKPMKIKLTKRINYFDNDDASVAYVEVESKDLVDMNKKLAKMFPFKNKKYDEYIPHMAIAYLKPGKRINVKFKPIEFEISYTVLSTKENEIKNICLSKELISVIN
jgi:hypothetical protein